MPNTSNTRLFALRMLAAAALLGVTAALEIFAAAWPPMLRASIGAGVAWVIGKYLGVPTHDVTQLALRRMAPDLAVQIVVTALQSLPPERAEAATATLLASLPPAARARVSLAPPPPAAVVAFVNTEPPRESA